MENNNKQRLFEIIGKVDKSFKPVLNEIGGYNGDWNSEPNNKQSTYDKWINGEIGGFGSFHTSLLKTYQLGSANNRKKLEQAFPDWFLPANDNIDEAQWGKNKANPKYTHFAVVKDTNKILNGWEYGGYDPAELRNEKKHYFFNDLIDMDINPKLVNIVTAKHLQKQGIDPYDYKNWHKNDIDGTDVYTS